MALFGPQAGNDIDADEREMLGRLAAKAATTSERVITDPLRGEVAQLRNQSSPTCNPRPHLLAASCPA